MVSVWLCLVSAVVTCAAAARQARVVPTAQGPVRGYKEPGEHFYAFYSIPYATAPTGPHKFKEPLPPPTWEDPFDATEKYVVCPQSDFFFQMLKVDVNHKIVEDCLVINVFVPDVKDTKLPVLVYVHGGGFQVGSGNMLNHTVFLESRKMIVVNFNYRLGAHGFLCLGTEDAPGNAGQKDQVAALRWVKRNIANFGGNPNDVTIAGGSAGSAAVELLLLSKSTRGLFNKVIPESGSGVGVWSVQSKPLEVAKSYAQEKGFDDIENLYALENFFKNLPFDELHNSNFLDKRDSTMGFVPCLEREGSTKAFMTKAPVDIIKNGDYEKLPLLMGFADMEGIFRLNLFEAWEQDMNENFSDFLPADLQLRDEKERKAVAQTVKEFYFGDQTISSETALGFVNYISDVMFVYPTYRSLSLQSAAGSKSLYLYVYAFAKSNSYSKYPGVTGANHCDQSIALVDVKWMVPESINNPEHYEKVKELLADVWKNFILTGKPTPEGSLAAKVLGEWQPMSATQSRHALFNTTSELRPELWPDRMALWDDIYDKYYLTPTPPPKPTQKLKTEL